MKKSGTKKETIKCYVSLIWMIHVVIYTIFMPRSEARYDFYGRAAKPYAILIAAQRSQIEILGEKKFYEKKN